MVVLARSMETILLVASVVITVSREEMAETAHWIIKKEDISMVTILQVTNNTFMQLIVRVIFHVRGFSRG